MSDDYPDLKRIIQNYYAMPNRRTTQRYLKNDNKKRENFY